MAGQLIQRGDRTWLIRVFVGRDETGKRRYVNQTVHGAKREAQAVLTALLRDRDLGVHIEPSKQALNEYLNKWLETAAKPRVRARTYQGYSGLIRRHVRPALGPKPLGKVTPLDIQGLYSDMQEQGLSARTIRYTHAVLRSALQQALKWRLLPTNPADAVDLPRQSRREMKALTPEQVRQLLHRAEGGRYGSLFFLAVTTGLRPSEYLALTWEDFDFKRGSLSVRRTLARLPGEGWTFAETKRSSSRRTVKLQTRVLKVLQQHRIAQAQERLQAGAEWRDHGLVFTTGTGQPVEERNLVRSFKSLLRGAGLPDIRLYDLRHTAATLALQAGVPAKVVSEQLGHASSSFTLDVYSHVLPNMQDDAAVRVEALLFQ